MNNDKIRRALTEGHVRGIQKGSNKPTQSSSVKPTQAPPAPNPPAKAPEGWDYTRIFNAIDELPPGTKLHLSSKTDCREFNYFQKYCVHILNTWFTETTFSHLNEMHGASMAIDAFRRIAFPLIADKNDE